MGMEVVHIWWSWRKIARRQSWELSNQRLTMKIAQTIDQWNKVYFHIQILGEELLGIMRLLDHDLLEILFLLAVEYLHQQSDYRLIFFCN